MRSLPSGGWRWAGRFGLTALVGLGAVLAGATPSSACCDDPLVPDHKLLTSDRHCVSAADASFRHTFKVDLAEHEAVATIRLNKDDRLCRGQEQGFALVSYLAPSRHNQVPQYVFDQDTAVIDRDTVAIELTVEVPNCFTQVDFVFGDEIIDPIEHSGDRYGDRKVGSDRGIGHRSTPLPGSPKHAWFNGGTEQCQTEPAVEAVSQCDGSLVLTLRNGPDATATEYTIIGTNGYTEQVELPRDTPVKEVTVPAQNAQYVKVHSDGKTIGTYKWERPSNCQQATVTGSCDCETGTISIQNPSNTVTEAAILIEGAENPIIVTLDPGIIKTIPVKAKATISVTVLGETKVIDLAAISKCSGSPPADPDPSTSTPGTLPVTGASVGLIAGGASFLLTVGAVLFVLARRRRVRFTAA